MNVSGGVFAALVAVAALSLGLVLGSSLGRESAVRAPSIDVHALTRAVAELREAVGRLDARERAATPPAGSPPGSDQPEPEAGADQPRSARPAAPARDRVVAERVLRPKETTHLEEIQAHDFEPPELVRRFAFRTYADILEEFGAPDAVRPSDGGVLLEYRYADREGQGRSLCFVFIDGLAVGFYN